MTGRAGNTGSGGLAATPASGEARVFVGEPACVFVGEPACVFVSGPACVFVSGACRRESNRPALLEVGAVRVRVVLADDGLRVVRRDAVLADAHLATGELGGLRCNDTAEAGLAPLAVPVRAVAVRIAGLRAHGLVFFAKAETQA